MWQMVRQPYQVIDDMFGRLVASNEPFLAIYLSGSFDVTTITPQTRRPAVPADEQLHRQHAVTNGAPLDLTFSSASLDLARLPGGRTMRSA